MQCAFFRLVIFPYSENQTKTRLFFRNCEKIFSLKGKYFFFYWKNLLLLKACFTTCEKILQIICFL